ncbi:c-type cytochrome [Motiliproteus sediminis]|uniref:c-type cytochrome n=1 Tax=Motiliproteus sediminis TaxID=1468178 RepID=UPI001AEF95D0|nr:c-type cytochrome [Motiliproteus sediminis]
MLSNLFRIKWVRISTIITLLAGFYFAAVVAHQQRAAQREQPVLLTDNCRAKLSRYGLEGGEYYRSPYRRDPGTMVPVRRGYSVADIRAIERGCVIIDDLQGEQAQASIERWNATRFVRGQQTSCDHCHQGVGDKQGADGRPQIGSLSLGASWVMADMYDRFTGLLLPFELRQMQCFINSSNGFKPNIADDLIRDVTAYSRFLSAALDLRIGQRYPEQGIDEVTVSQTLKRGDDYVRGEALYRQKCARCHGAQGQGLRQDGRTLVPAVAGPDAFNLQSRNNFSFVSTILPGFICRNMPLGEEGSLEPQQCRDIAFFVSNLPRPAGDKQGPLRAAWQQLMMHGMPPLVGLMSELTHGTGAP